MELIIEQVKEQLDWDFAEECGNIKVKDLLKSLDFDGDGRMDFNEFLTAAINPKVILTTNNIDAVFNHLDSNKDG